MILKMSAWGGIGGALLFAVAASSPLPVVSPSGTYLPYVPVLSLAVMGLAAALRFWLQMEMVAAGLKRVESEVEKLLTMVEGQELRLREMEWRERDRQEGVK